MNAPAAIREMMARGLTADQALIAIEVFNAQEREKDEARLAHKREVDRDRQRRHRLSRMSRVVTHVTRDACDLPPEAPPKNNIKPPPTPPLFEADASNVEDQSSTVELSVDRGKRKQDLARLREFAEGWNALAADLHLPQIEQIEPGSRRERHALARLRSMPSPDYLWPFIRGSPYLRGEVNDFRCTFDWIVNASNFDKIRDGNYAPRQEKPKQFNFLGRR